MYKLKQHTLVYQLNFEIRYPTAEVQVIDRNVHLVSVGVLKLGSASLLRGPDLIRT